MFSHCHPQACPHLIKQDGPVMAMGQTPEAIRYLIEAQDFDNAPLPLPKNLHLAFDETRNLRCPTCRHEIVAADKTEINNIFSKFCIGK